MSTTKIKTYLGVDIFLDSDNGKFSAVIAGQTRAFGALKSLEVAIRRSTQGVNVISLSAYVNPRTPETPAVVRVLRADLSDMYDQSNRRLWAHTYQYDEQKLALLQAMKDNYEAAQKQFEAHWEKRWLALIETLTPITSADVAEQLRAARSRDE